MIGEASVVRPALTPEMFWDIDFYKGIDLYFYLEAIEAILPNARVRVKHYGEMIMLGGYSYLGLLGHPQIDEAAQSAITRYGTGTHGVRLLAGTLSLHDELEASIARFKQAEAAVTFSSGYVTNVATISALLRRGDTIFSDKLNHASIVDGCLLAQAQFVRFRHNDMVHLEKRLAKVKGNGRKLVVADAVFSMDGDIIDLPEISRLCRRYGAYLMIDEAHSLGVLGATGHGIEEYFNLPPDTIDIKVGTFSKAIPSVGGYVAGNQKLIDFLKHEARAFIFSAALPPASVAASKAALAVIEAEPERVQRLQANCLYFTGRLREAGFDLMQTETAIIPVLGGSTERTGLLAKYCRDRGIFVQGVVAPVVPEDSARLRVCISAAHTQADMAYCADTIIAGGHELGILS